jgi:dTDP-4-amino-4,6-dideoxygalactose transaminase
VAEEAAGDILSLPVFPELTAEETASVAAEIRQFASEANG